VVFYQKRREGEDLFGRLSPDDGLKPQSHGWNDGSTSLDSKYTGRLFLHHWATRAFWIGATVMSFLPSLCVPPSQIFFFFVLLFPYPHVFVVCYCRRGFGDGRSFSLRNGKVDIRPRNPTSQSAAFASHHKQLRRQ
jgi:hypothetical protein